MRSTPHYLGLLRRLHGLGLVETAEEAGVATSTLIRLEAGECVPRTATLRRVEQALARLHARQVGLELKEAV